MSEEDQDQGQRGKMPPLSSMVPRVGSELTGAAKSGSKASSLLGKAGQMGGNGAIMGAGLAMNAARGGSKWVGSVFKRMGAMAMSMGTGISGMSGGMLSPKGGMGVGIAGILVVLLFGGSLIGSAFNLKEARREALQAICEKLADEPKSRSADGNGSETSADTEANAKKAYSVLSAAGMNDQNIAGILGNWDAESGIDPTGVEGIFDEPFQVGPNKKAKLAGANLTTTQIGIGLGQWTWDRGTKLMELADDKGMDWYDIETQLLYMLTTDSGAPIVQQMVDGKNDGADDPVQAAYFFHDEWERSADTPEMKARRATAAGKWYAKMAGWSVDSALADSVLSLVGETGRAANTKSVVEELINCPALGAEGSGLGGSNSDAAVAMVTFAWPFYDEAAGNNGTDLYVYLHDQVYPGDIYYASCDRSVGTAVRWSGTDDTFPPGAVTAQLAYVRGEGASKWDHVGTFPNDVKESDLKPGDVMIASGGNHIRMFVGKEAVKEVWPNEKDHEPNAMYAQGSLNDHSPGLQGPGDNQSYEIFRSKGKEKNSKFTSIKAPADMPPGKGDKTKMTTPGP